MRCADHASTTGARLADVRLVGHAQHDRRWLLVAARRHAGAGAAHRLDGVVRLCRDVQVRLGCLRVLPMCPALTRLLHRYYYLLFSPPDLLSFDVSAQAASFSRLFLAHSAAPGIRLHDRGAPSAPPSKRRLGLAWARTTGILGCLCVARALSWVQGLLGRRRRRRRRLDARAEGGASGDAEATSGGRGGAARAQDGTGCFGRVASGRGSKHGGGCRPGCRGARLRARQ